jgi:hypothetical protein
MSFIVKDIPTIITTTEAKPIDENIPKTPKPVNNRTAGSLTPLITVAKKENLAERKPINDWLCNWLII